MAGRNQQAIAMSRLVSGTGAHVLRLVTTSYLDGAGPSTQAYRRLAKQASSVSATSCRNVGGRLTAQRRSPVPLRRFASSASALQQGMDSEIPVVFTPRKPPRLNVRASTVPMPDSLQLPPAEEHSLFIQSQTPGQFIRRYEEGKYGPAMILPYRRLLAVANLFRASSQATLEDWEWLATTLARAMEPKKDLFAELPLSEGLGRCLQGLAWARAGEWERAIRQMAFGLKMSMIDAQKLSADPTLIDAFPEGTAEVVKEYVDVVRDADRVADVPEVVLRSSPKLMKILTGIDSTRHDTAAIRDLRIPLQAGMSLMSDPFGFLNEKLDQGPTSKPQQVYMLGNVFLASVLANPRRSVGEAYTVWRSITQVFNSTFVPAHLAAELAQRLGAHGHSTAAVEVFARMREKWASLPHSSLSIELRIYSQAGKAEDARDIWNHLTARYGPTRDDKLALATAFAARGDTQAAEEALLHLLGSDAMEGADALFVMQRAYAAAGDLEKSHEYLRRASAIAPRLGPYLSLLSQYADQGDSNAGVRLFYEMINNGVKPTVPTYTALISAFAKNGDYVNADLMFEGMVRAGHIPDAMSYSAVINASLEAGEWDRAANWCDRVPKQLLSNEVLAGIIMKAFVLINAPLEVTLRQFRQVTLPGERLWAMAMQAAADHGDFIMVEALFEEMDARSKLDFLSPAPNVYVFSILLSAFIRSGNRAKAKDAYDAMVSRKIIPSSVTYGLLTKSFADAPGDSSFEQGDNFARTVYKHITTTNHNESDGLVAANIFSPLIAAAGRNGDMVLARRYFDLVREKGGNSIYLTTVLMDAYRRTGHTKMVYRLWSKLFRDARNAIPQRTPDSSDMAAVRSRNNLLSIPLSVTIQALTTAGLHARIQQLWTAVRSSGFGFDAQNYNHLVRALALTGDVESAFRVVERVLIPRFDDVRRRKFRALRAQRKLQAVDAAANVHAPAEELSDAEVAAHAEAPRKTSGSTPEFGLKMADEESQPEPAPVDETQLTSDDIATDMRRPNRRSQVDAYVPPEYQEPDAEDDWRRNDLTLIRYWRPTDVLWRPSKTTLAILDQAYRQIEDQRASRAWVGVGADEEGDDPGPVRLPEFNNVVVKNEDSTVNKRSPTMILARINRYYAKTVALVMLHRRKQQRKKLKLERGK